MRVTLGVVDGIRRELDQLSNNEGERTEIGFLFTTQVVATVTNEGKQAMRNDSSTSQCVGTVLTLFLGLAAGCAHTTYKATTLPAQYMASPQPAVGDLDLSLFAGPGYGSQQIFPGDTLGMTVITGADEGAPEEWPVRVLDDGSVEIPMVGRMNLAGQDLQSAQQLIRTASIDRGVFRRPSVSLTIADRRTSRISVFGAVNEPGDYELTAANADLLSALMAAGGLAEDADTVIEIRHAVSSAPTVAPSIDDAGHFAQASYQGAPTSPQGVAARGSDPIQSRVTRIDLVATAQRAKPMPIRLKDGDVVRVHQKAPTYFHVIGLVNRADRFEIKPNESARVLDAVALAGGLSLSIADRVLIVRQVDGSDDPITIHVSLREAKKKPEANLLLSGGDVVSVEETPTTFLVGTMLNTVRLAVNGTATAF
jgi:polysaccharide export outer membrane protein